MGTLLANRLKTNESQNATIHSYTQVSHSGTPNSPRWPRSHTISGITCVRFTLRTPTDSIAEFIDVPKMSGEWQFTGCVAFA